jgi:hypothetical protein
MRSNSDSLRLPFVLNARRMLQRLHDHTVLFRFCLAKLFTVLELPAVARMSKLTRMDSNPTGACVDIPSVPCRSVQQIQIHQCAPLDGLAAVFVIGHSVPALAGRGIGNSER